MLSFSIFFSLVIFETPQCLDSLFSFDQYRVIPPQDLFPLQILIKNFEIFLLKGTLVLREVFVINLFWLFDFAEPENIEDVHLEFQVQAPQLLLRSSYFYCESVQRYNTQLSSFFIINSFFSNPLSAMLKIEYLQAGQLFMLKTIWVSGIGTMFEMFLGFGFMRVLPIGMCMLAAYLSRCSIGPKEVRFFMPQGLRELPLQPFRARLSSPFLTLPAQFFLGLITLQVNSIPSYLLAGKLLILMIPEWTKMHTISLLEVQGSVPQIFLLRSSGLCRLMYYDAMMILIQDKESFYALICELIETGQLYSWLVEIDAVVGGVTVQLLLLSAVVDDDPLHCRFFLAPIPPFFLIGVQEGVGGLFGSRLVAEIVEVRTFFFLNLQFRVVVFFLFGYAHTIMIIYIYLAY